MDIDSIQDLSERHALEVQIMEFGQIPKQIFKIPHPQRLSPIAPSAGLNTTKSGRFFYSTA